MNGLLITISLALELLIIIGLVLIYVSAFMITMRVVSILVSLQRIKFFYMTITPNTLMYIGYFLIFMGTGITYFSNYLKDKEDTKDKKELAEYREKQVELSKQALESHDRPIINILPNIKKTKHTDSKTDHGYLLNLINKGKSEADQIFVEIEYPHFGYYKKKYPLGYSIPANNQEGAGLYIEVFPEEISQKLLKSHLHRYPQGGRAIFIKLLYEWNSNIYEEYYIITDIPRKGDNIGAVKIVPSSKRQIESMRQTQKNN